MVYNVKIEVFEGPFDLLFHLIEQNEIDIYDIPMTEITDQYIAYIKDLEELNLELTSEFLVMAATLIEIKSKTLLPIEVAEDKQIQLDDSDPRDELVRKLLEYKKYKKIATKLKDREDSHQKIYFKPKEELIFDKDPWVSDIDDVSIEDLFLALNKCIKRRSSKIFPENIIRQIERSSLTVEDKINEITKLLNKERKILFQNMFSKSTSKIEIITTFLALLEIIRLKQVTVRQAIPCHDIVIELKSV